MLSNAKMYHRFPFYGEELFDKVYNQSCGLQYGISVPLVNIIENNNEFVIEVAAPGMEKVDFKIELNRTIECYSDSLFVIKLDK